MGSGCLCSVVEVIWVCSSQGLGSAVVPLNQDVLSHLKSDTRKLGRFWGIST